MNQRLLRHLLLGMTFLASLMTLSGCGFQLRGAEQADLPFESIYVAIPKGSELAPALKRYIQTRTRTKVVEDPKAAQVIFEIVQPDVRQQDTYAINTQGALREVALYYRVSFHVRDQSGRELIPASPIVIKRFMSYNDALVNSKEQEANLLRADMLNDMEQQIMRHLASIKL